MAELNFQTNDTDGKEGFDILPAGEYIAVMSDSVVKETKSGYNMLFITWDIVEGPFKGRKYYENLNLWNSAIGSYPIARRAWKSICEGFGKPQGPGPDENASIFHNKPMCLKIGVRKNSKSGIDENVIAKHDAYTGSVSPSTGSKKGTAPWQSK